MRHISLRFKQRCPVSLVQLHHLEQVPVKIVVSVSRCPTVLIVRNYSSVSSFFSPFSEGERDLLSLPGFTVVA